MTLYSLIYLFFFLPVFMGVYRLTPAKHRRWLIAAANLAVIASQGIWGLAVYGADLAAVYVSGRVIADSRARPDRIKLCRILFASDMVLQAAMFVFFAKGRGADLAPLSGIAVAGGAVIALHFVSYLADVWRGHEPADIGTLTAYSAFFPVTGVGPVLRYRRTVKIFAAPKVSFRKLGRGIWLYVFGLAEFLLISCRLSDVWQEYASLPVKSRGGAAAWLSLLIWYGAFMSGISGLLYMGQGTAMMMGLRVRQPVRRRLFDSSLRSRLGGVCVHLTMWIRDYICSPIIRLTGRKLLASAAGTMFALLWFSFGGEGLAAGAAAAAVMVLQLKFTSGLKEPRPITGAVFTKLAAASVGGVLAALSLLPYGMPAFGLSLADIDNEVFNYLLEASWLPLLTALFVTGSVLPTALRRMNTRWLIFILPVLEVIALVLCSAYMLNR